ncbi:MAG: aldehyde dehydrogenase family protein, partial [Pseudomonadales bacterium]
MLIATNPFNGNRLHEFTSLDEEAASKTIAAAHAAFEPWRKTSFADRADVLRSIAARLRERKTGLAELMAMEMGKPVKEGGPEVEKAALCAEHYADHAEEYLAREVLPSDASLSYVCYQPLGTVLGILPWNAPLWLASRFFAPALMAGNTCVLKHDPHVPGCAAAIEEVFADAPVNIFRN